MAQHLARVSSISHGSPDSTRTNEDICYFCGSNEELYLLVADGASVRVRSGSLDRFLMGLGGNQTAASYAAGLTRDVIAASISTGSHPTPESLLLAANAALRATIEEIFGGLTGDAVLKVEPNLDWLRADPRLIRLLLPVCVATIVRLDLGKSEMHFAHAGDTALFVQRADGTVDRLTGDVMEQHDRLGLAVAIAKHRSQPDLHISQLLGDEQVLSLNRRGGLYHNFVDENGGVDPSVGVGVINGLPELAHYIQSGSVDLSGVQRLLVCSDGFILPSVWDETEPESRARMRRMWHAIVEEGLGAYVGRLRALEREDHLLDVYPRYKVHDYATAIYVEVQHE